MERHGESPIIGHTGAGASRSRDGKGSARGAARAAARAAALGLGVVALMAVGQLSGAFIGGPPDALAAGPTAVNQTFTLFQGLTEGSIAATAIVDVQPYGREMTQAEIRSLHSRNSRTKVIRYVDNVEAFDTVTAMSDPRPWSLAYAKRLNTDAEWRDIWADHQSWFLRDSAGQYIHRPSGNSFEMNPQRAYLMDPGDAGWRDWLAQKVAQRLSYGYDGVFLDLCAPTPKGYSAMPAKYAADYGAWRRAVNGLIDHIKHKFPSALIITNSIWQGHSYYANASPDPIDDNDADGTEIEGFINGSGTGPLEKEANWLEEVRIVKRLGQQGKIVLARTGQSTSDSNSPKRLFAYALATFLLGKSSDGAYFGFHGWKWESGFDSAYVNAVYKLPLGDPAGVYYKTGIVYAREFSNGKVIVNPNDLKRSHTFTPSGAKRYKDQDGNVYDAAHPLKLPAKSGVILVSTTPVIPARPAVTGLSPKTGSTQGGDSVVISGTGLAGASKVTFGGASATSFRVDSATRITATIPAHAAGPVRLQVTTPGGASADTAADDFTYKKISPSAKTRYQQSDTRIAKLGSWADFSTSAASGGSYGRSSASGSVAIIKFTGTRLDWIGMKGVTTGIAAVYLDGVHKTTIDLAAPTAKYQVVVWSTGTLTHGTHTVKIVRDSKSAAGKYLTLDAVDIWGAISQPPVSKTRYDQGATHISKAGTWTDFSTSKASGGSYGRSSTSGASATIRFTGSRLDWIGMKGVTTGIADVYLDGVRKATIDLAASTAKYQVTVWSTGPLTYGSHVVKIVRSNSSAAGKFLTLDAVNVWGWVTN